MKKYHEKNLYAISSNITAQVLLNNLTNKTTKNILAQFKKASQLNLNLQFIYNIYL